MELSLPLSIDDNIFFLMKFFLIFDNKILFFEKNLLLRYFYFVRKKY